MYYQRFFRCVVQDFIELKCVFVWGSSGAGGEAAWERARRQRGGIYQQFQRGHACGQDPRCRAGRGAQNGDL